MANHLHCHHPLPLTSANMIRMLLHQVDLSLMRTTQDHRIQRSKWSRLQQTISELDFIRVSSLPPRFRRQVELLPLVHLQLRQQKEQSILTLPLIVVQMEFQTRKPQLSLLMGRTRAKPVRFCAKAWHCFSALVLRCKDIEKSVRGSNHLHLLLYSCSCPSSTCLLFLCFLSSP